MKVGYERIAFNNMARCEAHDKYEFYLLTEGDRYLFVKDAFYHLKAGDAFLLAPDTDSMAKLFFGDMVDMGVLK